MQFTIDSTTFGDAVAAAKLATSTQSTIPLLASLHIAALTDSEIIITGSDYETRMTITVPAQVHQRGEICVPADVLNAALKTIDADTEAEFSMQQSKARITVPDAQFDFATMPAADYPRAFSAEAPTREPMTMPAAIAALILDRMTPFVPVKDHRKSLLGIRMEFSPDGLTSIGTDGKIMAVFHLTQITAPESFSITLPISAATKIRAVLDHGEDAELSFSGNTLAINAGAATAHTQLITQPYPDWRRVFPATFARQIQFDRAGMLRAIRKVAVMKDRLHNSCQFDFAAGRLEVSSENHDRGRVNQTVRCGACEPFTITFGVDLLSTAFAALEPEPEPDLTMLANTPETPAVFHAGKPDEFRVLIMPIRNASERQA